LLRQITGHANLVFVEAPPVAPAEVSVRVTDRSDAGDRITITVTRPVDGLRSERGLRRF